MGSRAHAAAAASKGDVVEVMAVRHLARPRRAAIAAAGGRRR